MTLQELSKYYDIQMTLEKDREALERLRQRITPASPQLTGMPHTPGVRDKVGDLAVELADMDERIRWLEELAAQEKPKVEAYCKSIQEHCGCSDVSGFQTAVYPLLLMGRSCRSSGKRIYRRWGQPDGIQLPQQKLTDKPCICGAFYFCPKTEIQIRNPHKISSKLK